MPIVDAHHHLFGARRQGSVYVECFFLLPRTMTSRQPKPSPPRRSQFAHFASISTRWMDNDVYGHLNNVVYYSFFDTAVNQFLIEQGALNIVTSSSIGLVVHSECDYFASLAFPGIVEAGLRVAIVGNLRLLSDMVRWL